MYLAYLHLGRVALASVLLDDHAQPVSAVLGSGHFRNYADLLQQPLRKRPRVRTELERHVRKLQLVNSRI